MSTSDDDDADITDPRCTPIRDNMETALELQYLRTKYGAVKRKLSYIENAFSRRLASLEKEVGEFRRKLVLAKGFVYGIVVAVSGGFYMVLDKLKAMGFFK